MSTTHVRSGEGVHHAMIDGDHVAKAAVRDADGAFEVFEVVAPAAPAAPPHAAPWTGVLYVLEGTLTAWVDGETVELGPGDLVTMPAGRPCTFAVTGTGTGSGARSDAGTADGARFLAITSGDRAGRFFADFAGSVPTGRPLEDSMAAILAVTARHGVSAAPA